MKYRRGTRKISHLLWTLSRPGALEIFELAKNGIKLHARMHFKTEITQKQYRVRLFELARAELIEKRDNTYFHTVFGMKLLHRYIPRLESEYSRLQKKR